MHLLLNCSLLWIWENWTSNCILAEWLECIKAHWTRKNNKLQISEGTLKEKLDIYKNAGKTAGVNTFSDIISRICHKPGALFTSAQSLPLHTPLALMSSLKPTRNIFVCKNENIRTLNHLPAKQFFHWFGCLCRSYKPFIRNILSYETSWIFNNVELNWITTRSEFVLYNFLKYILDTVCFIVCCCVTALSKKVFQAVRSSPTFDLKLNCLLSNWKSNMSTCWTIFHY